MSPSASKVLTALRAARARNDWVTSIQLAQVGGLRFGARIMELRDAGHDIVRVDKPVKRGNHKLSVYRLIYDVERGR
jgi:hypothetical protein